jgi:hypothetical protein
MIEGIVLTKSKIVSAENEIVLVKSKIVSFESGNGFDGVQKCFGVMGN